jgi:hypothetical protein
MRWHCFQRVFFVLALRHPLESVRACFLRGLEAVILILGHMARRVHLSRHEVGRGPAKFLYGEHLLSS